MDQDKHPERVDLIEESDRGCVLVAAAMLDQRLTEIFQMAFMSNSVLKRLERSIFDVNGPLSAFSSKIKLARALGFLAPHTYDDLESIRKLRNGFAHSAEEADFLHPDVAKQVEQLRCASNYKKRFRRYSPTRPIPKPRDAHMRVAGYVKYAKTLFCVSVVNLEIVLMRDFLRWRPDHRIGN